jgi:hypothetical protein
VSSYCKIPTTLTRFFIEGDSQPQDGLEACFLQEEIFIQQARITIKASEIVFFI